MSWGREIVRERDIYIVYERGRCKWWHGSCGREIEWKEWRQVENVSEEWVQRGGDVGEFGRRWWKISNGLIMYELIHICMLKWHCGLDVRIWGLCPWV